jgi:hypothetical protein
VVPELVPDQTLSVHKIVAARVLRPEVVPDFQCVQVEMEAVDLMEVVPVVQLQVV